MNARVCIGTAGWTIPKAASDRIGSQAGTHLERYARAFACVEINSSFYRSHRRATYERWARSVPEAFAFSVKLPKTVTHVRRLIDCRSDLERFLDEMCALGAKRGVVLVQLPPSLAFDESLSGAFFALLRTLYDGRVACEPRHASWFVAGVARMLRDFKIARVAADPAPLEIAAEPGGWDGFAYFRWHGAPRTYYSTYDVLQLRGFADLVQTHAGQAWCIFDNTALGAATGNALEFQTILSARRAGPN